jgi:ribonuclease Z
VGYAFSERRKALRPEFEELRRSLVEEGRGKEFGRIMGRRRKEGVEVDVEVDRPLFAFLGDTHVDVFERNPWLFDYPVLITECTFLDDAEMDRANRVGHTVWSRLKPVVTAHPETLFVLIHFSLRYSDREVLAFFQREWEEVKDNVLLWVHPDGHLPEQHQHSGS